MINLLPPAEKGRVEKEYKLRLIVVNIFFLFVAFLIGFVLLMPSYFFANTIQKSAETEVLSLKNSNESTEREEINSQLSITNARLIAITEQDQRTDFYRIVDMVASYVERAIQIDTISYTRGIDDGNSSLQLSGLADTRDDLLSFKELLESNELFSEVFLPVSSLAKDQDIDFNIQIKGTF